jgi:hypothetical protein
VSGEYLLEISGCLLATGGVALATATAGRVAGISLTVLASGLLALILPPMFSLRLETGAGIAALLVNGAAGLFVALTLRSRSRPSVPPARSEEWSVRAPRAVRPVLADAIWRVIERDAELAARAAEIQVHVDREVELAIAECDLGRMLRDILKLAFGHAAVHRADIYYTHRPEEDGIRVVAMYGSPSELPCQRITGRTCSSCEPLAHHEWPAGSSATWFDNGFERIYQIRMMRN